jgi:nucleoside-diphosphate-sugar epimerase
LGLEKLNSETVQQERPGAELRGQEVLVTGATGFVGNHLTRRLLGIGAEVRILVRKSSNSELVSELEQLGARIFYGDVSDQDSVDEAADGVSFIFHIAALFRQAKFDDSVYYDVNVEGVRHMINAAEKNNVQRLVHCSTIGVHSHILNPPADENEDYRPDDIYQVTKCEGEKLAKEAFKAGRVKGAIIRPAMIWGEGDTRILKLFKGVSKRTMPIIGDGKTMTHWIYVHDLVDGFILAAIKEAAIGQVYIIAGRRAVPLEELVERVAECAGTKPLPVKIPACPVQVAGSITEAICKPFGIEPPLYRRRVDFFTKDRHFDTTKAQTELGFQPRNTFEEEVSNIFNWYQDQGWL